MGSWSESCAVSGVEIREQSRVYGLTWTESYNCMVILIPPVLGLYNDYGQITLQEDLPQFDLKKGEDWRGREETRGSHMFIDAEVFDNLANLEPEFTYGDRPKTLGEAWARHKEKVVELLTKLIEIRDKPTDDVKWAKLMMRETEVFGYSADSAMQNAYSIFDKAIEAGATLESLETLIEAYGRAVILNRALTELRKRPSPGAIRGPQHGGEQALIPFYHTVLSIARKRRAGDRDECWNIEELDKEYPLERWKAECAADQTLLGFRDWQIEQELA